VFSQIWLTYFLDHLFDLLPKSLEENPVPKCQQKRKSDEANEVIIQKAV
jgi:hypothetical protein